MRLNVTARQFPEWRRLTSFAVYLSYSLILLKTLGNSAKIRDFPYPDKNAKPQ